MPAYSKLFMLLHINADGRAGGAVTIPGDTIVNVPGHGAQPLWYADKVGGPSLVVKTITDATGVPINHYARIDFNHVASLMDAIGGMTVTIPKTSTAFGQIFHKGANFLTGITAIYYALDPSISDQVRVLRQENLLRATMTKIADDHLLTNPVTTISLLNAITGALTVDSNMTNSDILSLARKLRSLGSRRDLRDHAHRDGKRQARPEYGDADQLWTAIKKNSIAKFATAFPTAVTPRRARDRAGPDVSSHGRPGRCWGAADRSCAPCPVAMAGWWRG